jgi:hypothetical protein
VRVSIKQISFISWYVVGLENMGVMKQQQQMTVRMHSTNGIEGAKNISKI